MGKLLEIGQALPSFEAKDFEGAPITKEDLLGAPFVIYFYPKDDTPGCTKEACSFRDLMDAFDDLNVMVVGVSPDSPESHQKFMEKHELNFPLISDESLVIAKAFGVIKEQNGKTDFIRTTFVCDEDGIVQWVESPVDVNNHAERVIEALNEALA
jgi:thioredoxin-dependent peroxiredoxin